MSDQKKPTVTKKDIVQIIVAKYGTNAAQTGNIVQECLDQMIEALATGKRIEFRDFGIFDLRQRAARTARNPKTGAAVQVPPRSVVYFRPGKVMKERTMQAVTPA